MKTIAEVEDKDQEGTLYFHAGLHWQQRGELAKAEEYLKRALGLFIELKKTASIAKTEKALEGS